jgi:hypothetical protein
MMMHFSCGCFLCTLWTPKIKTYINLFSHFLVVLNHVWVVSLCIWLHCDGLAFNSFFVSFIHLVICMVTFSLFFWVVKIFLQSPPIQNYRGTIFIIFCIVKVYNCEILFFLFHIWSWWWPFLWNYPSNYARLEKILNDLIFIEALDYNFFGIIVLQNHPSNA